MDLSPCAAYKTALGCLIYRWTNGVEKPSLTSKALGTGQESPQPWNGSHPGHLHCEHPVLWGGTAQHAGLRTAAAASSCRKRRVLECEAAAMARLHGRAERRRHARVDMQQVRPPTPTHAPPPTSIHTHAKRRQLRNSWHAEQAQSSWQITGGEGWQPKTTCIYYLQLTSPHEPPPTLWVLWATTKYKKKQMGQQAWSNLWQYICSSYCGEIDRWLHKYISVPHLRASFSCLYIYI